MGLPLTEEDYALFEPARIPAVHPRPVREVEARPKESQQSQNERAHKVWMQSLIAYAISGLVALGLFMVVSAEAGYHQALVRQRALSAQLQEAQQRSIGYQTKIERKFSLDVIQDYARNQLHMTPVEGSRVTYINVERGDQRLE
ncbi:MAG: hypothetical protein LBG83_08530 [Oscillospiraceae bacterium]|jgi:hypothetical protein|nr:hypothetical protein [Oscillospiraceae bacterium]